MKTSFISAYNLEALAQTNGTHEITVNTSKEFYALHDYLVFTLGWDCYEYAHVSQDGSVTINIRVNNNQPEPTNPDNTPTTMNANEAIANTPANLAKLHALAVNDTPMFYIWLDAVDDAATTLVYLTEGAARADIARLEADDKEAGVYEPEAYRIINAAPYFA